VIVRNDVIVEQIGRIKLHLSQIEFKDVERAVARKQPIKVALELTSEKTKPVFASVRADKAKWEM
ncbi:MAG TPA: DUF5990 family protein, partial [Steroidobacteraceae bacterium]|nr:DUF5990 family protein [Steroidobacteraceae bacterium]